MGPLRSDRTSIYGIDSTRLLRSQNGPQAIPNAESGLTSLGEAEALPRPARPARPVTLRVRACFQLRPDQPSPQSQSFPKLRIRLAHFPYLHCSIDQRLFTLETCCGYGYDLRRQSTLVPRIFNCQPNIGCCSRRSALQSSRFQANPPLTKKRQLFSGLQPASGGSIASQI